MPATTLTGVYEPFLVLLSVVIAICASYVALDLAERTTASHGRNRAMWLTGGAMAMGIGIWSMHYIGMLAFRLPIPVLYHLPTVFLSVAAAIFSSTVVLYVVSRPRLSMASLLIGSLCMAAGICAMHYTGMAAMRLRAVCHYDSRIVALSVAISLVCAYFALWIAFRLRSDEGGHLWRKAASAVLMGIGVSSMHYTGMAAVHIHPTLGAVDTSNASPISSLAIAGIVVITFMILAGVFAGVLADRMLARQARQLASTQRGYRLLFQRSPAGVFRSTLDGEFLEMNDACSRLLGGPAQDCSGDNWRFHFLSEDDCANFFALVNRDGALNNYDVLLRRNDGDEIWALVSASLITYESSHPEILCTITDISMQKKTELALSAARVAAEEASAAKSQFLANMSHEIRTPLNGIVGMTELALGTNLDAEQRDYLEMVLSSADALLTVVNDILDFSKMQAKGPELQIRSFVLRDLLTDTMKPLIVQGREKGLQIICDVAGDVPRVLRGDPGRLRQVFVNLISNAIKFTDRGSVSVGVEVAEQNETGAKLHMYVRDTGIGIPEDKCDLIFEAFAQAEDSNTRRHGGTGLGLAISSKLAEAMNGRLGVESIPGSGSTFHFEARFGLGDEQGPQGDSEARRKELESVSHYS